MKRLTWWFRLVGAFYTLLALMNLYGMFVNPAFFAGSLPYAANDGVIQAFIDGWSPFAFEIVGIGTFLLWASRNPRRYVGVVWLVAWLEIWHGVVDDLYLISRGYSVGGYVAFIAVHLLIAGTGVLFARQVEAAEPAPRLAAGD